MVRPSSSTVRTKVPHQSTPRCSGTTSRSFFRKTLHRRSRYSRCRAPETVHKRAAVPASPHPLRNDLAGHSCSSGAQWAPHRRGLCAGGARAHPDLRRSAHHQLCPWCAAPYSAVLCCRLRSAALRDRTSLARRGSQLSAGDARTGCGDRERLALCLSCGYPHGHSRLCVRRHPTRPRVSRRSTRHGVCRRDRRGSRFVAVHAIERHRQSDPRGGERKARRRARGHRSGPHLRRHLRPRYRLSRHRCLPPDPDLLRQSPGRKRLCVDRIHHRRARRHGLGRGRIDRRPAGRRCGKPLGALSRRVARPNRYFHRFYPGAAASTDGPVRAARLMRAIAPVLLVIAPLACVPVVTASNLVLNFVVTTLLLALLGQAWNVLGGYGGQYSFGHAAFFGTGAYVSAILQVRFGMNAWLAFCIGIAAGAFVGAVIGTLCFRSGLRGSYFALVTLAFAEVLRIMASVTPITGAGVGTLIPLDLRPEAFQFQSRAPFYWIMLTLVAVSLVLVRLLEKSRFGAWLVAVRENEDAASALGIDAFRIKLAATTISAAIAAAAGGFYAQYFLFIDAGIAYGPRVSVEALLAAIIGGLPTVFGPLLGAIAIKTLGELTKLIAGDAPGLDLVVYGVMLIVVVVFAPRGIAGLLTELRDRFGRGVAPVPA